MCCKLTAGLMLARWHCERYRCSARRRTVPNLCLFPPKPKVVLASSRGTRHRALGTPSSWHGWQACTTSPTRVARRCRLFRPRTSRGAFEADQQRREGRGAASPCRSLLSGRALRSFRRRFGAFRVINSNQHTQHATLKKKEIISSSELPGGLGGSGGLDQKSRRGAKIGRRTGCPPLVK